ncbi:hypothetical protein ACRRTK_008405 [Alexandromys fortis]
MRNLRLWDCGEPRTGLKTGTGSSLPARLRSVSWLRCARTFVFGVVDAVSAGCCRFQARLQSVVPQPPPALRGRGPR